MVESRKIAIRETLIILIGEAVGTAIMFGIFALLHRFDLSVLLGGIVGVALSTGNFFFMALAATLAAEKAKNQDTIGGERIVKSSYSLRLLVLAGVLFACGISGFFNPIALVLPLAFVRPVVLVCGLFQKR